MQDVEFSGGIGPTWCDNTDEFECIGGGGGGAAEFNMNLFISKYICVIFSYSY